jgi:hypothetical protein
MQRNGQLRMNRINSSAKKPSVFAQKSLTLSLLHLSLVGYIGLGGVLELH